MSGLREAVRGARLQRATVAVVLGAALLALVPGAATAAAPAAVLDSGFGTGGVTTVPAESALATIGAPAQNGSLVVSGGSSVQLLNGSGGTGEAFGGAGALSLPSATGREFALADFTVDPQGRLLVVGSSIYPEAENPSPPREDGLALFKPAVLRILRFLPDGSLDPSFGQGGIVENDRGLPSPRGIDGQPLGSHPSLRATGVAVDSQGRIVVTGDAIVRLGQSCERNGFTPAAVRAGFVTRLTESGASDPIFGAGGLVGGRALGQLPLGAEEIAEPTVSPTGVVTYRSTSIYACTKGKSHIGIAQLTADGRARNSFGRQGALVGHYGAIAEEPDGSVVALAAVRRHEGERFKARLTKIGPSGKLDGSFGQGGWATIELGPGFGNVLNSLAVDTHGRVLVGGTLEARKGRSIAVLRVSTSGKQEMNFGPHGRVATRVRGLAQFAPSALFFDAQARLVTVHLFMNSLKGLSALVVARYLLQN
jgi:uncharacterized delta-60 repeat protein